MENNPLWLGIIAAVIPLGAASVTSIMSVISTRSFRANLKADAETLKCLPDDSDTYHALLESVDKRVRYLLREPARQGEWVRQIFGWSVLALFVGCASVLLILIGSIYFNPIEDLGQFGNVFPRSKFGQIALTASIVVGSAGACGIVIVNAIYRYQRWKAGRWAL